MAWFKALPRPCLLDHNNFPHIVISMPLVVKRQIFIQKILWFLFLYFTYIYAVILLSIRTNESV